ncbi:MAG: HNH endonuclease [Leptolyngbyaceae cyanobacterium RM2_2_4]|jgi:5-methylcytosine-specific restriction endonuclease McrA|nr:HNH endonuclease [Leptolyngbyaceae cyanobacterium SM1_4_3]NJO50319.1 HNH endonuclease [Leptolyngbyaceae cyanobacterium RM2_2_4]
MKKRRHFTSIQKLIILKRSGYLCEICGVSLTPETFHADHKIPYSLGGETAVYNGQALCSTCNLKKGNRLE